MVKNESKIGLLDLLAMKSNSLYLSDLANGNAILFPHYIQEINADDYDLEEWMDAIEYITKEKHYFNDSTEAKDYMIDYLRKHKN